MICAITTYHANQPQSHNEYPCDSYEAFVAYRKSWLLKDFDFPLTTREMFIAHSDERQMTVLATLTEN
jgi:hypothetical protein